MMQKRKLLIGSTAVVLLTLLYFFFDARNVPFPRCPFLTLTGLYCPGCGSQRAFSSLLHGAFIQAAQFNLLLFLFLPLLGYVAVKAVLQPGRQISILYKPVFVNAVLVLVILFALLRNLPLYPFTLLAPPE